MDLLLKLLLELLVLLLLLLYFIMYIHSHILIPDLGGLAALAPRLAAFRPLRCD